LGIREYLAKWILFGERKRKGETISWARFPPFFSQGRSALTIPYKTLQKLPRKLESAVESGVLLAPLYHFEGFGRAKFTYLGDGNFVGWCKK